MRKALLSLLVGLMVTAAAFAQNRTVTGRITSPDEPEGLIGVNVLIKGTTVGVVTDLDGNYSLQLPANATTLVFNTISGT
jgi:hypothetical protein